MNHIEACIALNMVPNMGPVRLRKLLEVFETPESILGARTDRLQAVNGIGKDLAASLHAWEEHVDLPAELQRIEDFGAYVITEASEEYPRHLREIYNPPMLLYVWGKLTERDQHAIGVVGSRKTSHYGMDSAKKLSFQLAYAGLTVVSGLARGIDTAAHQGALAAQGRTVAVIGSGLMELYPPENLGLAEKISASGAVVSEFPMQFPPSRETFPYRNRIVAGWGSGTLVVEAGLNSGALITANQALEQGRQVYAVPGQIDRPTSGGSNRLIQQGAKLVTGAGDILEDLQSLFPERPLPSGERPAFVSAPATAEETAILAAIEAESTVDDIIGRTGLMAPKVFSTLLSLEMKRMVKQLPGQRFVKVQQP